MSLRDVADEETLAELRRLEAAGAFPGLSLKVMLEFLLSDGIMPESGLPVRSLLRLEDWARERLKARANAQR
jgi:hypothetical protein